VIAGVPVANLCSKCGADNPAGQRFCGQCGTALGAPAPAASAKKSCDAPILVAEAPAPESLDGERKTVTALFADIKGSMELIEDLDPEEARAIVDPALKLMMEAVQRYGGYVAQSTGDGIFALFGAPVAYEDHPQRALYAALRMQEELKRHSDRIRSEGRVPVQVRVGVNSGEVVVRTLQTGEAHTEYVPIGHATSLAARMQALAPIGSIAATEAVRKLCEGYFTFKGVGPTKVKGVSAPVEVYEVIGLGPLRTHFQLSARRGLTKFVGREPEMGAMAHAAELAKAGHGQIVGVVAEPGVGKSRLFFEFKARNQSGWMVLEAVSTSYGKASAFQPVIDLLHAYLHILPEDDGRTRREKVTGRLLALERTLEEKLPYFFSLLGIVEGDDLLGQMDTQVRRQRTFDAIRRVILRESVNQPLMLMFEDLHWVDDETQMLLSLLADSIAGSRVLLLLNYRPEYRHDWGNQASYTQLRLEPLLRESADEMLSALMGDNVEVAPLRQLIIEKTEGTPFFIEETIQALFEDGTIVRDGEIRVTRSLGQLRIPTTLQALLASRIDRLPDAEKELLQTLAVIGAEFSLKLAARVVGIVDEELSPMLLRLQQREFIHERLVAGDFEYAFKHALTRQVAYDSMLADRRKSLHERVATAIEALYSGQIDDWSDALAQHYGRTSNTAKTVEYLFRSGQRAAQRSAFEEGIASLKQALELLQSVPEDRQRVSLELRIQDSLILWWAKVGSMGSAEIRPPLERRVELCEQIGDGTELFRSLLELSTSCIVSGELPKAHQVAQRTLNLAEEWRHPSALSYAHALLAQVLQAQGELAAAEDHFEKGVSLAEAESQSGGLGEPGFPIWLGLMAENLWLLGYPDRALASAKQVMTLARSQRDEWFGWTARYYALHVLLWRRDSQALDDANQLLTFASERGFSSGTGTVPNDGGRRTR
jgi:class 3 adenylate cyclase/tetratricopeptide (TPR) repeat protein